jgi:hypothetical protein
MPTIQRDELIAAVREFATADPNHVYAKTEMDPSSYDYIMSFDDIGGCLYSDLGVEQCIVGRALSACGVMMSTLRSADLDAWGSVASVVTPKADDPDESRIVVEGLTEDDVQWLMIVQDSQDKGLPWAEAVYRADIAKGVLG